MLQMRRVSAAPPGAPWAGNAPASDLHSFADAEAGRLGEVGESSHAGGHRRRVRELVGEEGRERLGCSVRQRSELMISGCVQKVTHCFACRAVACPSRQRRPRAVRHLRRVESDQRVLRRPSSAAGLTSRPDVVHFAQKCLPELLDNLDELAFLRGQACGRQRMVSTPAGLSSASGAYG